MPCASCQSEVPASARFCPACGAPLGTSAPDAETVAPDTSATHLASPREIAAARRRTPSTPSGWLSSSSGGSQGRFAPGTVLAGRYRITNLLGRGGMGEVYRADDLRLGQVVALKFLPEALGRDPVRLAQFHNEVRVARQVSHPNVCRVYDIGETDDLLFLSMEYVDGEDLASLIRRIGRLPEDKALDISRQICAGLAAAHDRGVIHRDLKPANVMLDGAGKVRLMDFGLAAIGDVADVRAGTPAYMAPEQLQGHEVTARSDIFSLGLVLYELFTGRRAFEVSTLAELVERHEDGHVTPPTQLVKGLDPAIDQGVMRCLVSDPKARPPSALAVSGGLPGGDPLAAALAAGETPSPDLVAAAGGDVALMGPGAAVACVALVVAVLLMLAAVSDRAGVLALVPPAKPMAVLADRADELRERLGYTTPVGDATFGMFVDYGYLSWDGRHGAGKADWADLGTGRPAVVRFWRRTSPALLVPFDGAGAVDPGDPPVIQPGMTRIDLDLQGHLILLHAVPAPAPPAGSHVDWDVLFQAAGLDRARFTEVPPASVPLAVGDERTGWIETTASNVTAGPLRIDGVGFQGRPTYFEVSGEWAPPVALAASRTNPLARIVAVLVLGGIPLVAAVVARLNLNSGRGDRRGAFRLWAFAFGVSTLSWIVSPTHVPGLPEVDRMFATLGLLLFRTGEMYVAYLALEPYVRRTWPTVLITWSRVLSGKIRDPLVGRDILAGVLAGLAVTLLTPVFVLIPRYLGWTEPQPLTMTAASLQGVRLLLARVLARPTNAMQDGMLFMFVLTVIRQGLRRLAGPLPRGLARVVASDALLWLTTIALLVVLITRDGVDPTYPWTDRLVSAGIVAVMLFVAFRFGLFALVWGIGTFGLVSEFGLTLDSTKTYAASVWFVGGLFLVVAVCGVWLARGSAGLKSRPAAAPVRM